MYRLTLLIAVIAMLHFSISPSFAKGDGFGMSAAIGMPSGLLPSAGIPTTPLSSGGINFTYGMTTNFVMLLNDNLQLEAGIGYITYSVDLAEGEDPDPLNTISVGVGGRYFLRLAEVQPYVGAGISFTTLPTIPTGLDSEISATLLSFIAFFGVQGFINKSQTVALFIQMGIGFNSGTVTEKMDSEETDTGYSTVNFGGSAVGAVIYF